MTEKDNTGLLFSNMRFQPKRSSCFAEDAQIKTANVEIEVLLVDQPFASLIMCKRKKYIVLPYPVIGRRLLITRFSITAELKKVADTDWVKRELFSGGFRGWEDLPQKSILGQVNIETCRKINDEFLEELKNKSTFERSADRFEKGLYVCEINEVLGIKPIPTTPSTIVRSIGNINIKLGAIRKL